MGVCVQNPLLVHEWQIPAFGMKHLQDLTPPFSLLMINDKHTQSHTAYTSHLWSGKSNPSARAEAFGKH